MDQVNCTRDILSRIGKASSAFSRLKSSLFTRNDISIKTKMRVYNCSVIPVLLYGAESWVLSVEDLRKLEVAQMYWLRTILKVSLHDHLRNEVIRERCCQQPEICQLISQSRLRWFGHLCRMENSRLPKQILLSERPPTWKCPSYAPKLNWRQHVMKDIARGGLTTRYFTNPLQEAMVMAQDRTQWRGFTRDVSIASNNQD